MRRILIALAVAAATAPVYAALQNRAGELDAARLLYIDVVALNRSGAPVHDLTAKDLEVWIGGFRTPVQTLVTVKPGDDRSGRSIVLLLDDMTLPAMLVPQVRRAARRFVNRMVPGDQMAVIGLSGDAMKSTSDPALLLRRIDDYGVRATGVMRPDQLGAHVLSTIASLARQLSETSGRRKTIVGIGSGWLFDTPMPPPIFGRDLNPEWVDAMRALAFAQASVYVIDPGGVGTSRADGGGRGFAHETGGHAFLNTNDVNGAADRIMREAGSYYLIGVADPPAHRKAPLREVEVRVLRRGITVRARRGIPGTEYVGGIPLGAEQDLLALGYRRTAMPRDSRAVLWQP